MVAEGFPITESNRITPEKSRSLSQNMLSVINRLGSPLYSKEVKPTNLEIFLKHEFDSVKDIIGELELENNGYKLETEIYPDSYTINQPIENIGVKLLNITESEKFILNQILSKILDSGDLSISEIFQVPAFIQLLAGAFIEFEDDGELYEILSSLKEVTDRSRTSSHTSDVTQFSLNGPFISELLFGRIGNKSWIQLEKRSPTNITGHTTDYIRHRITTRNIGPYGISKYTELNPLTFTKTNNSD